MARLLIKENSARLQSLRQPGYVYGNGGGHLRTTTENLISQTLSANEVKLITLGGTREIECVAGVTERLRQES